MAEYPSFGGVNSAVQAGCAPAGKRQTRWALGILASCEHPRLARSSIRWVPLASAGPRFPAGLHGADSMAFSWRRLPRLLAAKAAGRLCQVNFTGGDHCCAVPTGRCITVAIFSKLQARLVRIVHRSSNDCWMVEFFGGISLNHPINIARSGLGRIILQVIRPQNSVL